MVYAVITLDDGVERIDTWLEKLQEQHSVGTAHSLAVASKLTNRIRLLEREIGKADKEIKLTEAYCEESEES